MAKPTKWTTAITSVAPNELLIAGYPLEQLVAKKSLLDIVWLLATRELPSESDLVSLASTVKSALETDVTLQIDHKKGKDDISKTLAWCLVGDRPVSDYEFGGNDGEWVKVAHKMAFSLGRMTRFLAIILGFGEVKLVQEGEEGTNVLRTALFRAITGEQIVDAARSRMIEAMVTASVDHGVTPPSAQATLIAASTRAAYEVAVAHGIGVITDVHGGAGGKAAEFFSSVVASLASTDVDSSELMTATAEVLKEYIGAGKRVQGLGHRVHSSDPRRQVLWTLADDLKLSKNCVAVSKVVTDAFTKVKGKTLPINVDGVIGAIVADLGLDPALAKAVFIIGRVVGLSGHYHEELGRQQMRRINFSDAVYDGIDRRDVA